jgi:Arc/MetJ family transcription regulator
VTPAYTNRCHDVRVTRTNIDIDDLLVQRVMRRFNLPTKRAAVDFALRRLLGEPMSRAEILAMQGVGWSDEIDALRRGNAGDRP